MRKFVFFWLLIACLGMAVLSQVGNQSLLRDLKCFSGNSSGCFDKWDLYSLKGLKCGTGYIGFFIYRSVIRYWQFYTFDNLLRLCAILSSLYAFCVVLHITFTPEDKSLNYYGEPLEESNDEVPDSEDTGSSTEMLVSYFNASRLSYVRSDLVVARRLSRSVSNLRDSCAIDVKLRKSFSCGACIWTDAQTTFKGNRILKSFSWREEMEEQAIVFSRWSFSGFSLDMRKSVHEGVDRLSKSLSLMRIDLCSEGSRLMSDTIKTCSNLSLATTSSRMAIPRLPSSSCDSFKTTFSSVNSLDSVESFQCRCHSTWTVHNGRLTRRRWHSMELLDSIEFAVRLPRRTVSCEAWNTTQKEEGTLVKEHEILKSFSWREVMPGQKIVVLERSFSLDMGGSVHNGVNRLCRSLSLMRIVSFEDLGSRLFHETLITLNSSNHSTPESNTVDLINNTEVILAEIPRPMKRRIWSSMFELHNRKEKWQSSAVYTSLSNLKFSNRTRRRRKRNLLKVREKEQVYPPVEATHSSFFKVLKEESYQQIVVPMLLHAGKELLLSVLRGF